MNAIQKVKWLILARAALFDKKPAPEYPCPNVDELFDKGGDDECGGYDNQCDATNEVREGQVETKLPCGYSRHYESKSVASKLPDGSWVGWTYWYGGGKHGQPEEMEWIGDAYDVKCVEEQKLVTVQTFSK